VQTKLPRAQNTADFSVRIRTGLDWCSAMLKSNLVLWFPAFACLVVLPACVEYGGLPSPVVSDFSSAELTYRMLGDSSTVLTQIEDYLAHNRMPSTVAPPSVTTGPPKTYVVTAYLEEPHASSDRRTRRTAFRFAISPNAGKQGRSCSYVSLSTLTQSRGIHEETWSVQRDDETFSSSFLPALQGTIEKQRCD
jgi:hypothetical protein